MDDITKYTLNFRSFKNTNNVFNNISFPSMELSQDDNYINIRSNPHPYIWNFTNSLKEDNFFGKDNKHYTNKIDNLKSLMEDTKFKAFGNINKWVACGEIKKGLAVILITHNVHHTYPVGNSFTVLNRGKSLRTFQKKDISREELLSMMAGGEELDKLEVELKEMDRLNS